MNNTKVSKSQDTTQLIARKEPSKSVVFRQKSKFMYEYLLGLK